MSVYIYLPNIIMFRLFGVLMTTTPKTSIPPRVRNYNVLPEYKTNIIGVLGFQNARQPVKRQDILHD